MNKQLSIDELEEILEAYRKDCQRTDDHAEGGMHLSKDQAKQALLEYMEREKIEARVEELRGFLLMTECCRLDCRVNHGIKISKVLKRIEELEAQRSKLNGGR